MTKKRINIYSVKDQMEKYNISEEEAIEKIKQIKILKFLILFYFTEFYFNIM